MFELDKLKREDIRIPSLFFIIRIPQSYGLNIPDGLFTINLTET